MESNAAFSPVFEKSEWIWANCPPEEDQYTEYVEFLTGDEESLLRISCDSDYTLWVNGRYVASNQYGDFAHYKIYDTLDLTPFLNVGENKIQLTVYYCGVNTQRYRREAAGLIYEVLRSGTPVLWSGTRTLSRKSPAYVSGQKRFVSSQLGFSFSYDATQESEEGYAPSLCVEKRVTFYPRPVKKQAVLARKPIEGIEKTAYGYLIDLGEETVGLLTLELFSHGEQWIRIAYGESLDGGRVRARIHNRGFFVDYKAKNGNNAFTDYMLRLGCRYLEVQCEGEIEIAYVGLLPQVYEVEEHPVFIADALDRSIYRACVNTLRLCMMEHYVDTPWREQCLYAFDSRNQMLCGYDVFKGGNADYARANLALLGEDRRADGLLSICAPCGTSLAIPSFSLYYVIEMKEYAEHTGDTTLFSRYAEKIEGILDEFLKKTENGLICAFSGDQMWNFYDWSEHLSGRLGESEGASPDLVINALFVLALDAYEFLCKRASRAARFEGCAHDLRIKIAEFFSDGSGMLTHHRGKREYTVLGNALAVLCGAVTGDAARALCDRIVKGEMTPSSLSMNIWKYDALLLTDEARYRELILGEIRETYKLMLEAGSSTVWETAKGSSDFGNAGSLCHGWSAVPITIYHRLGIAIRG